MWADAQRDDRPANTGGTVSADRRSLADAHCSSAVQ